MTGMVPATYAPNDSAYSPDELSQNLGDRLTKSLRLSGMSVPEMAQYLEVHRNTVRAWMDGKNTPNALALKAWAARTNVPYAWLRWGPDGKPAEADKPTSKK